MKTARLALISVLLLLLGCACAQARSEEEMNHLGSALVHLSSAVESAVHVKKLGAGLSDDELLAAATRHDPGLLTPFKDYRLKVQRTGGHSSVLVCTGDGREVLLEDAACSPGMDAPLWRASPPLPCEPTLDLNAVCPK